MTHDDEQVGRVLTRREVLGVLGATGVVWLARCSGPGSMARPAGGAVAPGCVVRPEMTAGPYFVDGALERSDVRADPASGEARPGTPLDLEFRVSRIAAGGCVPLAGAVVDVWQCDALGIYSDVRDARSDTRGQKFLRGHQVTDPDGVARFTTIYPGWYQARAVHVHFKIRSAPDAAPGFDFTSQLFFDDALTDQVHATEPYASHGRRRTVNADDSFFRQGGADLVLALEPSAGGYRGTFEVALEGV